MELNEVGTMFDLTPMVPPSEGAALQQSAFWRDVLPRYKSGDHNDYSQLPSIMLVRCWCLHGVIHLADVSCCCRCGVVTHLQATELIDVQVWWS